MKKSFDDWFKENESFFEDTSFKGDLQLAWNAGRASTLVSGEDVVQRLMDAMKFFFFHGHWELIKDKVESAIRLALQGADQGEQSLS
jgi:hypothetical protein